MGVIEAKSKSAMVIKQKSNLCPYLLRSQTRENVDKKVQIEEITDGIDISACDGLNHFLLTKNDLFNEMTFLSIPNFQL